MRVCRDCGVELSNDNRYKNRHLICKQCDKNKTRDYRHSKRGLIVNIYDRQRCNSKIRGHQPPTYSRDDLYEWAMAQKKFHVLYDNWKRLDFQKDYAPSVDRKDDEIGYTMANIQLMTWRENYKKGIAAHQRQVVQMDLDYNEIATFESIVEAGRNTNIERSTIGKVCRGVIRTTGGYRWKYKIQ